jgi:hypothetical protein
MIHLYVYLLKVTEKLNLIYRKECRDKVAVEVKTNEAPTHSKCQQKSKRKKDLHVRTRAGVCCRKEL